MVSMIFTSILAVISTATFIGNILVDTTFVKTPSLRTSTNYYIVNQLSTKFYSRDHAPKKKKNILVNIFSRRVPVP